MAVTNTTSIAGPGPQNPFSQISSALAPIYSMFGPTPASGGGGGGAGGGGGNLFGTPLVGGNVGGGGPGSFGLSPMVNPDNSLTREWYNLANIAGPASTSLLTQGGNLVNQGMGITNEGVGVTGEGLGVTGAGLGVTGAGLGMFKNPSDYWSALLAGNPQAVAAAAGPYANILSKQMNAAETQTGEGTAMGGERSVTKAGEPQLLASQIGDFELGLQPTAAKEEANIANQIAGIGQGISGTGTNISGTGVNLGNLGQTVAGTGTTLTGQGMQGLDNLIRDVLEKMGINITGGTSNTFGTIATAIGNLLGGAGKIKGIGA